MKFFNTALTMISLVIFIQIFSNSPVSAVMLEAPAAQVPQNLVKTKPAKLSSAEIQAADLLVSAYQPQRIYAQTNGVNSDGVAYGFSSLGLDAQYSIDEGSNISCPKGIVSVLSSEIHPRTAQINANKTSLSSESSFVLKASKCTVASIYSLDEKKGRPDWIVADHVINGELTITDTINGSVENLKTITDYSFGFRHVMNGTLTINTSANKNVKGKKVSATNSFSFKNFAFSHSWSRDIQTEWQEMNVDPLGHSAVVAAREDFLRNNFSCTGSVAVNGKEVTCDSFILALIQYRNI